MALRSLCLCLSLGLLLCSLGPGVSAESADLISFLQSIAGVFVSPRSPLVVTPRSVSEFYAQWPRTPTGPYNVSLLLINGNLVSTKVQAANFITYYNLTADTSFVINVKGVGVSLSASFSTPKLAAVTKSGSWFDTSLWPYKALPCASDAIRLPAAAPSAPPTVVQVTDSVAVRGIELTQFGSGFSFTPGAGIYLFTESQASAASDYRGLPTCPVPPVDNGSNGNGSASSSSGGGLPLIPIAAGAGGGIILLILLVILLVRRRNRSRVQFKDGHPVVKDRDVSGLGATGKAWNSNDPTISGRESWAPTYGGEGHAVTNYGFQGGSRGGSESYAALDTATDDSYHAIDNATLKSSKGNNAYDSPPEDGETYDAATMPPSARPSNGRASGRGGGHANGHANSNEYEEPRRSTMLDRPLPNVPGDDVIYEAIADPAATASRPARSTTAPLPAAPVPERTPTLRNGGENATLDRGTLDRIQFVSNDPQFPSEDDRFASHDYELAAANKVYGSRPKALSDGSFDESAL